MGSKVSGILQHLLFVAFFREQKKSWNNSNKAHLSGTYFFYKDQIYKTIK